MNQPGSPAFPAAGSTLCSPRGVPYILGRRLGEGAFGAVFEALGPFEQPYAVKVARPRPGAYETARNEWLREAAHLVALRHPHIVYAHDYFEIDGLFVLVLERCDHTLADMLGTPFTDRLVVEVSRQLLFAVQVLHDSELVHNDLHAGNVLVVQGDPLRVKVGDLGIALELYGRGAARPTIVQHGIMAPEVAAGGYSTKQSDLYQLGLLMFAMHTGEYPLDVTGGYAAIVEQIKAGVPRARAEALGTPIGEVVSVMLRRHEQYRFTSAAQIWEELRKLPVW